MTNLKNRHNVVLIAAATATIAGVGVYRLAYANGVPADVPVGYSGRLSDNGAPVNGTRNIGISLYASSSATTPLCQAASMDTSVVNGFFQRTFPSTCPKSLIASAQDLHVEVFVGGVSVGGPVRVGAVPYALETVSAQNGVPIGGIIDWWRPVGSTALPPAGFAICDGSAVADSDSPYNGQNLPDLRNVFVRGVGQASDIGTMGGSDMHLHSFDLPSHQHSVVVTHGHTASASTVADHHHAWAEFNRSGGVTTNDNNWYTWNSADTEFRLSGWADGMDSAGAGEYPVASDNNTTRTVYTSMAGGHTHSITVATYTGTVQSSAVDPAPQDTLAASNVPAYYGLLKIIRIK